MSTQTPEKNKEIVRKLYQDCLNKRNFELLKEFIAEDYAGIRGEKGPAGFTETVQSIIQAFPDIRWTIEDLIEAEDKVVVRWSWQGTHEGTFRGFLQASHKKVTDHAIVIYQFRDHKIIKAWIESDRLGFLQQIGVVPQDLGSLAQPQKIK